MILPKNGAVVIIDDRPEEALPIIKVLSKKGISTTYYQGNNSNDLPERPIQPVRLVFLDLQLIETADEHQVAKSVVNVLEKIIPENNGPYILIVWSKNRAKYERIVSEEINRIAHLMPVCVIGFNKRDCLDEKIIMPVDEETISKKVLNKLEGRIDKDEQDLIKKSIHEALQDEYKTEFQVKPNAIDIIEGHISEELKKAGVFHLFVIWENLVRESSCSIVKEISSLVPIGKKWESNMQNIFKRMGNARVGKNVVRDDVLIKEAINTLNSSFTDTLEVAIKQYRFPEYIAINSDVLISAYFDESYYDLRKESDGESMWVNNDRLMKGSDRDGLLKSIMKEKKVCELDRTNAAKLINKYNFLPISLNSKLHIEFNPLQELIPGNIYHVEGLSEDKKKQYLHSYFKRIEGDVDNYTFIDLEVSPICDYAQNKWKRSRVLPGIIFPSKFEVNLRPKAGNYYDVEPTFDFEGSHFMMRFDYHLFNAVDKKNNHARQVIYRLKREILLDIIAQLSSHVNRPGITFMT